MNGIPTLVQPECMCAEHFSLSYDQENLERCSNCGSSLFRNYNEPVQEGSYVNQVCAVCNERLGGIVNPYNTHIHYYNGDYNHPFMCCPIKKCDVESFRYDPVNVAGVPAIQFIDHLTQLGYYVNMMIAENHEKR
jgi:hypothetical protein